MTTGKPTYIQERQQVAISLKAQMCRLLKWDEMQYGEFQYKTGIAYLMWYLPCDDDARDQLQRSKLYWNWFKNLWAIRDAELIADSEFNSRSVSARVNDYEWLHCPRALAVEAKPNSVVLSSIKKKEVLL